MLSGFQLYPRWVPLLLDVFLIDTGKYIDITIKTASVHLTQTFTLIIFNFALETIYITDICSVPH